jgi:hypothetical protein
MPSSIVQTVHDADRPVAKRQKLGEVVAPRGTRRESRIFTPFRVCLTILWMG